MSPELNNLDATAQAELVRKKAITPLELTDAAISAIEQLNPELNAIITPLFDKARALAKSDAIPDGPFHGVPFLLNDLVCASAGDPIYNGARILRDAHFVAPYDNYLAAKFKAAGFIIVGKTNTPEFGLTVTTEPEAFGASRNPWGPTRSTGGSSGGSAAAVAARMVAVAHANDGGGSIRIPASECGLLGLKPSRGRVSAGPDFGDLWAGLVIEGVVSRSVRDTASVLDAIAGNMPGDPYAAPPQRRPFAQEVGAAPGRLRIGFMKRTPQGKPALHPDRAAAVAEAARVLQALSHTIEESHPPALDEIDFTQHFLDLVAAYTAMDVGQLGALFGRKLTAEDFEPWTWNLVARGAGISAADYLAGLHWLQVWSRRVAGWWSGGFDLLLTPTIAEPPVLLGTVGVVPGNPQAGFDRLTNLIPFTPPFNITGQPAISLPLFWNAAGLPIGSQLVAGLGREDLLIQVASQLEQARPWQDRKPVVSA
jgi:amidase